jgi:hypothetical protein
MPFLASAASKDRPDVLAPPLPVPVLALWTTEAEKAEIRTVADTLQLADTRS